MDDNPVGWIHKWLNIHIDRVSIDEWIDISYDKNFFLTHYLLKFFYHSELEAYLSNLK